MCFHLLAVLLTATTTTASNVEFRIKGEPYFESGIFHSPRIPTEGDEVTFTVRATVVEGELTDSLPASFRLISPNGQEVISKELSLAPKSGFAETSLKWEAGSNGLYRAEVVLDPEQRFAQETREDDRASIQVPVVVRGRRLYFPWFHERQWLTWANIWAGSMRRENLQRWLERGVLPLRWKFGNNLPEKDDGSDVEERFYRMYLNADGCPGIAIDEFGCYPLESKIQRLNAAIRGLARAKKEKPDQFVLVWHTGSLYPEQAALYRSAADLVVIESYVFYYVPRDLKTENIYDFIDMKMQPVRQVDALAGPPASKATIITSVDLKPESFDRGEMEQIIRHLRRKWPEMRGFGIFGTLVGKEHQDPQYYADEKFIDSLCYEYFIRPVVTFLPQSLWVSRRDDGVSVTAALSNIGGMDSGPVKLEFLDNGERIGESQLSQVNAGDSRLTNRTLVSIEWTPKPGPHTLEVRITEAENTRVLDSSCRIDYFW